MAEFWDLTPQETFMTIEARLWREAQQYKRAISQAWLTAALGRAKRLPALPRLLASGQAQKLSGAELEQRRQEFREMSRAVNFEAINRQKAKSRKPEAGS